MPPNPHRPSHPSHLLSAGLIISLRFRFTVETCLSHTKMLMNGMLTEHMIHESSANVLYCQWQ